ncbi:MAG: phosphate propanoyltransferase [Oscillospiraceae bacterium]|jgi:putative phosphotransacetylase|nr:phosphate propanoyltransferase [Oscillospiraceae bacterium]
MSKPVLIETSARHVHVSRADLDILFGAGHELKSKKDLSQPGQYACEERVRVVGPKGEFPSVSILGPVRPVSQVELSAGDARSIGIKASVRESGDTADTPGCTLVGPNGSVELKEGVIVAKRHIHMTPSDAEKYALNDRQTVQVAARTDGRALTFGDVVVRVHPNFALAMHVDTDESNAAGLSANSVGEILG